MLKWYEENGKFLGFDDDTYVYRVAEGEDGWSYENIPDLFGFEGFETAEEAKAAAEEEYAQYEAEMRHLMDMTEPIDPEEAYWVLVDIEYERAREERAGNSPPRRKENTNGIQQQRNNRELQEPDAYYRRGCKGSKRNRKV